MDEIRVPRVLIVDDDAAWRELIRLNLENLGYEVIEADNGRQALDTIRLSSLDLVLLDVTMPGMSGIEVVRKLPPDAPPVVLLTCKSAEEVGPTLYEGARYYLPKEAASSSLYLLVQSLIPRQDLNPAFA